MNFSDYQKQAWTTAAHPDAGDTFTYPTLGLVGEAGELADKIKKQMRDKGAFKPSDVSAEDREEILKELGDVLWYVSCLATEFDEDLQAVAQRNIDKLQSRQQRGAIGGDGDNR